MLSQAEIFSLREGFLVGSPEKINQNLRYWEEVGVDRVVMLINFGQAIPHPKVLASLERFAKYVIPQFAEDKVDRPAAKSDKGSPEAPMASRQASIVSAFLDELEERAKKKAGEHELPAEVRDWFSWARNRVDAAEPVFRAADSLVAENSSLHE